MRGRVLAETSGKSPKPAKKNNHHETAYAALDWDIGPDTTAGVGYLYQQLYITPDNGLPAYKNGKLLPLPQKSFTGAHWNHFDMQSHDVFADIDHYFVNGAYGKIGLRYSDRDAQSNYAFAGSALDDQLQVTPTGLGTNIKQKALAFGASYSQPFNWGAMRNEYVVGADYSHPPKVSDKARRRRQYAFVRRGDATQYEAFGGWLYNHFKTSNEQGRARALGAARDYRSLGSLPYTNILGNARAGSRGFARTLDEETLDEAGVYGKLVVRPLENLSLIGGGRVGRYQITSGDGTAKEKRHGTPITGYAGVVWDFSKTDSLYASYSSLYRPQTAIDTNGRLLKPAGATKSKSATKAATSATASTPASASTACKIKTPPPASPATTTTTPRSASASCKALNSKRAGRSPTNGASMRATATSARKSKPPRPRATTASSSSCRATAPTCGRPTTSPTTSPLAAG